MGKEKTVKDEDLEKISGAGTLGSINPSQGSTGSGGDPVFTDAPKPSQQILPGDGAKDPKSGDDLSSNQL